MSVCRINRHDRCVRWNGTPSSSGQAQRPRSDRPRAPRACDIVCSQGYSQQPPGRSRPRSLAGTRCLPAQRGGSDAAPQRVDTGPQQSYAHMNTTHTGRLATAGISSALRLPAGLGQRGGPRMDRPGEHLNSQAPHSTSALESLHGLKARERGGEPSSAFPSPSCASFSLILPHALVR